MPDRIASTIASRFRRPDPDDVTLAVERPGLARRLWLVLPVGVAFALFGVVVWLAYQEAGLGPPSGEPPLIRAVPDPVKLRPDETEETTLAEQGTVGRLWSDVEQADQPERLLPSPEAPLSPPAIEESATAGPTVEQPASEPDDNLALEATGEDEESDVGVATLPSEPTESSESAAAQSASDQSLQEAEAALDRLLAEVTAMSEDTDVPAATDEAPAEDPAGVERPAAPQESPASEVAPATASAPTPGRAGLGASTETPAPEEPTPAPLPQVRPAGATAAAPAAATEPPAGSTETAALSGTQAPTSRPAVVADGAFRIQLAAVRGEADARRAWQLFMSDLGPVLAGVEPIFERADTANGVFYRVQVGPFASQEAAENLCEQLKERNASCFVIRR